MAKNPSNSLDIPTQISRRLRQFSRQCYKPAKLAPTSIRDMSESQSCVMIGSRDLEKRIRFESACRSLTAADTFFTLTSRA